MPKINAYEQVSLVVILALLFLSPSWAADKEIAWQAKYYRTSVFIKKNGLDYFGNMVNEQQQKEQPLRLDSMSTEISSNYHQQNKTLVTLIRLNDSYNKIEQSLIAKASMLDMTVSEIFELGKLSLVCRNPINRAAIDQGLVFQYEIEDDVGRHVSSVEANKASCVEKNL